MMSGLSFHRFAAVFPLLDGDEFAALVEDIRANGLRQRIVLFDGAILDGRNRFRACIEAGVEPRFEPYNGNDPLGYVVSLNLKRRHLNASQRATVATRIATLKHGGDRASGKFAACSSEDTAIAVSIPTQEQAASMLNVSERSVRHARTVLDKGAPELIEAVDRGEVAVSLAAQVAQLPESDQREILAACDKKAILEAARKINAVKWEERRAAAVARTNEVEFNAQEIGKFGVIYGDPPWRYENPPIGLPSRRTENHYPTMSLDQICAMPVRDISHENAILFLWATAPKLYECIQVIDARGFNYRTCMVWAKDKIGMGYYVRNQHELLLICKRGEMPHPPEEARCSSLIAAPRLEHSAKPEKFYDIIDDMYPGVRKIELFNRGGLDREGWSVWGNEARGAAS
jgi:N6-adenosine-specific RNA methylase IME4